MQLTAGSIVEGKVTGITKFGVFVDLGGGKKGMVHISEVAQTYVNDINDFVKMNDTVKVKVLSIAEDGKIALSIKKAEEPQRNGKPQGAPAQKSRPEFSSARKPAPTSFEEMMAKFKQTSDEKFSDLKRKNPDARRTKRGSGIKM